MTKKLDYGEFIKPTDLVFDVGANVGEKTAEFLKFGATVICFEPNVEAIGILYQKYYADPRVKIEPIGLYDREDILQFYPAAETGQSTFSLELIEKAPWFPREHWKPPVQVHVSTLDIMFKKWGVPKFIKIDVESSEERVLVRMDKLARALSFEFYPTDKFRGERVRCIELLTKLGYHKFNYIINSSVDGESDEYRFDDWVDRETLLAGLDEEPRRPRLEWGDVYTMRDK
jgi:FkbM family methyltransferase